MKRVNETYEETMRTEDIFERIIQTATNPILFVNNKLYIGCVTGMICQIFLFSKKRIPNKDYMIPQMNRLKFASLLNPKRGKSYNNRRLRRQKAETQENKLRVPDYFEILRIE